MGKLDMTITLITGGNKGLGFETARRLIGLGHTVYLGARDEIRGHRLHPVARLRDGAARHPR